MKILHVDLHRGWGGGQSQLLLLAKELAARGYEQTVAATLGGALAPRAALAGLPVSTFRRTGELDPRAVLALRRIAARSASDVLHAHDPHGLALAALAARTLRPRPAVVGHRRVEFPIRQHLFSRWKYRHGTDRLIAVSRWVRDVLVAGGVHEDRITVVHDAVDPAPLEVPTPSLRERIGAPPEAPIVLTLASTAERKDHPTLIEAAARLRSREPPARWVVLGGEGPAIEALRAAALRRGLEGRLHYVGFLPDARACLDEADVFALTSKAEALGSSILEAMAAGVPVVATRTGGIPEIVEHETTGLLALPGDAPAIAAAIDRLLDDRALAAGLALAARARLGEFDPARTAARVEAVYREALRGRRAGYSMGADRLPPPTSSAGDQR